MRHRAVVVLVRALVPALALALLVPLGTSTAVSYTWSWNEDHSDVAEANRRWVHRPPSVDTGQKSAFELSARRNANDRSKGRAEAARATTFSPPVQASSARVLFFGKQAESDNETLARLRLWIHCSGLNEVPDEWVLLGGKDVPTDTTTQTLRRRITDEDCATHAVNGVMLQVVAGERGDRRRRTVYLERAELWQGGAAIWTEDFTTP